MHGLQEIERLRLNSSLEAQVKQAGRIPVLSVVTAGGTNGGIFDNEDPPKEPPREIEDLDAEVDSLLKDVSGEKLKDDEKERLQTGAPGLLDRLNCEMTTQDGNLTKRMIQMGRILNELQRSFKGKRGAWTEWADENIPFIGERMRQMYMKVAKEDDAIEFACLGSRRIISLVSKMSAAERKEKDTPIRKFLVKKGIEFSEPPSEAAYELRKKVDEFLQPPSRNDETQNADWKARAGKIQERIDSLNDFVDKKVINDGVFLNTLDDTQKAAVIRLSGKVSELKSICDSIIAQ
jgi:hypothetical protein